MVVEWGFGWGASLNSETGSVCWILKRDAPFITGGGGSRPCLCPICASIFGPILLEIRGSAVEVCDTNLESNSRAPPGDWETTEHYSEGSVPTPQDVVCLMV